MILKKILFFLALFLNLHLLTYCTFIYASSEWNSENFFPSPHTPSHYSLSHLSRVSEPEYSDLFHSSTTPQSSLSQAPLRTSQLPSCHSRSSAGDLCQCEPLALHPTQFYLGMREVEEKVTQLRSLTSDPKKLDLFIQKNLVPIVIGPEGEFWLIDHHHLTRAYLSIPLGPIACKIVQNNSSLSLQSFSEKLSQNQWVYLYDYQAQRQRPFTDLPSQVLEMKDDPYRSLAGEVRRRGGFQKTTVPFAEFYWGEYLRQKLKTQIIDSHFELMVQEALKWVHDPEAKNLPGYLPESTVEDTVIGNAFRTEL